MLNRFLISGLLLWTFGCTPATFDEVDGGAHAADAAGIGDAGHPADAAVAPQDSGATTDAGSPDGGSADAGRLVDGGEGGAPDAATPLTWAVEMEPNSGTPITQVNPLSSPYQLRGAVDPADDIDVITVPLEAGQFWRWTVDAEGSSLSPHLTVFTAAGNTPTLVAHGDPGARVTQEQFVLRTGTYILVIRDRRNVAPFKGSSPVGGSGFRWALSGQQVSAAPVSITWPSTHSGALASQFSQALYRLSLATSTRVAVEVLAQTKVPSSTLDARLAVFDSTRGMFVAAQDDRGLGQRDPRLVLDVPAGDFLLIVDSEDPQVTALDYQLKLSAP